MSEQPEKVAAFMELLSPDDKLPLVCNCTERHYRQGETVAIYTSDQTEAAELDSLLWTFRQNAFIPHVRLEKAEDPLIEPVVIFSGDPGETESDVLILASADELPPWFDRFPQIYDFAVIHDEDMRKASRARFTACKEAGYRMRFIKG